MHEAIQVSDLKGIAALGEKHDAVMDGFSEND